MNKKLIIGLGIFILWIGGYFLYGKFFTTWDPYQNPDWKETGSVPSIEAQVEKKDFESSVELEGTTKIKNEQQLRFNTPGRVLGVYVQVGDPVTKGQELAKIDASEVYTEIEKAQLDVENAQSDVDKFVKNINTSEIQKVNLNIDAEKLELEKKEYDINYLQTKQAQALKEAELALEEAKNNLQLQQKEAEKNIAEQSYTTSDKEKTLEEKALEIQRKTKEYEDFIEKFDEEVAKKTNEYHSSLEEYYRNIEADIQEIEKQLNEIGKLVGIGPYSREKPEYSTYFSAKNSLHKGEIRSTLYTALWEFRTLKSTFEGITDTHEKSSIIWALEQEKKLYDAYYTLVHHVALAYKDSITTNDFNPESYESTYTGLASTSSSKITTIGTTIHTLKTTDTLASIKIDLENEAKEKKLALENLKIDLAKTKDNQKYLVESSTGTVNSIQIKLEQSKQDLATQELELEKLKKNQAEELAQAKIDLEKQKLSYKNLLSDREELLNLADNTEYKLKKNVVKQAQVSLQDAQKKLENYVLTAPFDGKVTKLDIATGDRLNADTEKYISISDPNAIEINVSINQSDITKIKKGMQAEITMKAYQGKTFTGTVSEINTTPKEDNGLVKFDAKVVLEKPEGVEIYSGLKATVKIIASKIEGALVVPFTAVSTGKDGKKYVMVIKNGSTEKKEVQTGFTDGKQYQITSGLTEGETILEIDYSEVSTKKTDTWEKDTGIEELWEMSF